MNIYLAEMLGTALLIYFGEGVNASTSLKKSYGENSGWIVTTIGWGLSVTFAIYAVGSISGAHINPAVTLGLAAVGYFEWALVPGYILAQVIGATIGATLVWLHFLPHWKATDDPGIILGVFSTGPAIPSKYSNLFSELSGTFALVFGLSFIGVHEFASGLNPLVVGGLIVTIGMALGTTTGYAINPARDLGPRIAHAFLPIQGKGSSNWSYAWVPIVGPLLGGVLGATLYQGLFNQKWSIVFWISLTLTLFIIFKAIKEQKP
ncbi:MAG: aquaporin family protein [Reichenbachiella sp.]